MTYVVRFWGDGAVAGPFADYGAAEAYLLGFPPAVDADIVSLRSPGIARVLFSSATGRWATPRDLYATLDAEFGFDFDPCPLDCPVEFDGLAESWSGRRVFCNPPYGAGVDRWLRKAREATLAVYLLPARTDTAWWHKYAMHADEIRFLRGRLRFGGATASAPFPSVILVYRAGGSGGRPA
jgi:site-specific DNA-methyltransferase (adenine-specific)